MGQEHWASRGFFESRSRETMSEAEGEWADLLHESALEAVTAQASAKPASEPKPAVTRREGGCLR